MTPAQAQTRGVDWREANRQYLMARVAEVRARLQKHVEAKGGVIHFGTPTPEQALAAAAEIRAEMPAAPALDTLSHALALSPFEESIVVAAAAVELDTNISALCASATGETDRKYFTVSLALSLLAEPHWTAVTPDAPLRRWRVIELSASPVLTGSGIRLDERILHYLLGASRMDPRLAALTMPAPDEPLLPSQEAGAEEAAAHWNDAAGREWAPLQVTGESDTARRAFAAAIARKLGFRPVIVPIAAAPATLEGLEPYVRLWERESALERVCPIFEADGEQEPARAASLRALADSLQSPSILLLRTPLAGVARPELRQEVPASNDAEQLQCWRQALGAEAEECSELLGELASQFRLTPRAVSTVCRSAKSREALWDGARKAARGALDELAQRLTSAPRWDDLVLPEGQREILTQIAAQVRQRTTVYGEWGFHAAGARGLGLAILFAGPPGTGKTLAAEVLATELKLDLYRIDLSSVVSKYIGDTERNLRRVFDAAESCGAILLFDEADALFGPRSEVKDSHDRYANIEVSYLLQRMESYRGLAVLTTNRRRSLDEAFQRRLRFAIEFPLPDFAHREAIWRRVFPVGVPLGELIFDRLASLDIAGGNIRNIALNAAFLAASAGTPVAMRHLAAAARAEYAKMERSLTQSEIEGWE